MVKHIKYSNKLIPELRQLHKKVSLVSKRTNRTAIRAELNFIITVKGWSEKEFKHEFKATILYKFKKAS